MMQDACMICIKSKIAGIACIICIKSKIAVTASIQHACMTKTDKLHAWLSIQVHAKSTMVCV